MRFTLPLMSLMLTSAFAMTIAERQNDVPVCKNGEIDDAAVGGPWPASGPCEDVCYGQEQEDGDNLGKICKGHCNCFGLITGNTSCVCSGKA